LNRRPTDRRARPVRRAVETCSSAALSHTGAGASTNRSWKLNGPNSQILDEGTGALSLAGSSSD
jgi:hypothetical protein